MHSEILGENNPNEQMHNMYDFPEELHQVKIKNTFQCFLEKKRFFDIQLPIFHAKTQVFMLKSTFLLGEMTPFHGHISLFCGKTHCLAPRNPDTWNSWLPNATSGNLGMGLIVFSGGFARPNMLDNVTVIVIKTIFFNI